MYQIVIVDDEHLECEVLGKIIDGIDGAQVAGVARSCRQGIELCAERKPDLVLLNCNMGGISGLEAARQIRANDSEIRIVLTTADSRLPLYRDMVELDIHAFLLRPVHPSKIERVVRGLLRFSGKADSDEPAAPVKMSAPYPPKVLSKEITSALLYIDANFRENLSLEDVADIVFLSSYYFSRLFKKEVGINFSNYLLDKKLTEAKRLLIESDQTILEISASLCFKDQSYFCKVFKKYTEQTPKQYRSAARIELDSRRAVAAQYILK